MRRDERFRGDDGKLDLGKIKWYEDSSYKIVLLERYIDEQQDTIQSLKEENEQLRGCYKDCKKMLSEAIEENELLECKEGVHNVHRLKKDYEQLKEENEQLKQEVFMYKKAFQEQVQRCTL